MGLSRLYDELNKLYEELDYLHYSNASPGCIEGRRQSIHCKIAQLEDEIEYQKRLRPLRIATIAFVVITVGIFLYFII